MVVRAIDRLTRRLADLSALIDLCEETGVKIATVSGDLDLTTSSGKLMARILGSIAQGEVETKSSRQKLANRQLAESGKARKGRPRPFGWQADRITLDEAEAKAIRSACTSLLAKGTITGICRDWERRGLRPHQAPFGPLVEHPWTTTSVRLILRNPRNAGIAIYKGTEVAHGEWESIVPEETFRAVAELLADTSRKPTQGIRSLLGCLALCHCGNFVAGSRGANGQASYRCHIPTRGDRPGPHVFVRRAEVDAYIGECVVMRLARDDAVDLIDTPESEGNAMALREEAEGIRRRLMRLSALYSLGTITEQVLTSGVAEGETRRAEIKRDLEGLGQESVLAELISAAEAAGGDQEQAAGRGKRGLGDIRERPPPRHCACADDCDIASLWPGRANSRKSKVITVDWDHGHQHTEAYWYAPDVSK